MNKNKIFLVGFMAAGKSTIGRVLAAKLGYRFIDLDRVIVERSGLSIPEIFEKFGEKRFRELEEQYLLSLTEFHTAVVALGGGTFISETNRRFIANEGVSVWLNCDIAVILNRVAKDSSRPLNKSPEQMKELLNSRIPIYSLADLEIETTDLAIQEVVSIIIEELHLRQRPALKIKGFRK